MAVSAASSMSSMNESVDDIIGAADAAVTVVTGAVAFSDDVTDLNDVVCDVTDGVSEGTPDLLPQEVNDMHNAAKMQITAADLFILYFLSRIFLK